MVRSQPRARPRRPRRSPPGAVLAHRGRLAFRRAARRAGPTALRRRGRRSRVAAACRAPHAGAEDPQLLQPTARGEAVSRAAPRVTLLALVLLLAGAEATACREAVAPCATRSRFEGNWRYEATQTSPSTASISGTLVLKTAACHAVAGSLDAVARDAEGRASRVAGEVDGREADSMSVTFDVYL